jgi:broad specificity phosphatase PhoE
MTKLILVRHGQTEKNIAGQLHHVDDREELNEVGIEQMLKTASKLKVLGPARVYASKGHRAVQSGELIAKELGVALEAIDGMQERNWGDFSDKTWNEVQKMLETMSLDERYTFTPPHGESWEQFEKRLVAAIGTLLEKNQDGPVVVITHGGAIRALMPYLLGAPKEESFKYSPDNASITIFSWESGAFRQICVNDTSHLKGGE